MNDNSLYSDYNRWWDYPSPCSFNRSAFTCSRSCSRRITSSWSRNIISVASVVYKDRSPSYIIEDSIQGQISVIYYRGQYTRTDLRHILYRTVYKDRSPSYIIQDSIQGQISVIYYTGQYTRTDLRHILYRTVYKDRSPSYIIQDSIQGQISVIYYTGQYTRTVCSELWVWVIGW